MSSHLECSLCFEPFNSTTRVPKFLKCNSGIQHTFCLECLHHLFKDNRIKCPSCQEYTVVIGSAASLIDNIYLLPQIEKPAAAPAKSGLVLFCKICKDVATENCDEHELLRMSQVKDTLRDMALTGAENTEKVKGNRSDVLAFYNEAHDVFVAAAHSIGRTIEEYDIDMQMDENISRELERKREGIDLLKKDQLKESYHVLESHVSQSLISLKKTSAIVKGCEDLMRSNAALCLSEPDMKVTFPVAAWFRDGDLMKAVMAAGVVTYVLDGLAPLSGDECGASRPPAEAVEDGASGKPNGVKSDAHAKPRGAVANNAIGETGSARSATHRDGPTDPAGELLNSVDEASARAASGKSTSANGVHSDATATVKTDTVSEDATGGKTKTKSFGTTSNSSNVTSKRTGSGKINYICIIDPASGKTITTFSGASPVKAAALSCSSTASIKATSSSNGAGSGKASPPGDRSACIEAAKSDGARTVSFSTMVKKSGGSPEAAAAREPSVPRAPRGVNPLYALGIRNGNKKVDVVIELRPDLAPIMCKNFVRLSEDGLYDNTTIHRVVNNDHLVAGVIDDEEGYSPLAHPPNKFIVADSCPLPDECGAIRMKGMGHTLEDGKLHGWIGSMFMIWVSETREYREYSNTLVFGYVRHGIEFVRRITTLDVGTVKRNVRLLTVRRHQL